MPYIVTFIKQRTDKWKESGNVSFLQQKITSLVVETEYQAFHIIQPEHHIS